MKMIWQPEDIKAGRLIGHPDRLERFIIGYIINSVGNQEYSLVSLSDGLILERSSTAQELAEHLNSAGEIPLEFFSDPSHVKRGQKGGAARSISLSAARRAEIASNAANTRWGKNKTGAV